MILHYTNCFPYPVDDNLVGVLLFGTTSAVVVLAAVAAVLNVGGLLVGVVALGRSPTKRKIISG